MNPSESSVVHFGPYELDRRIAELRKNGRKIRLAEQPFQILVALLERPGEVVLREEIRQKLWPEDTIVEFDHSINTAIRRLRDALSETAEKPRYVETVARRGYRFISKLEPGPSKPEKLSKGQAPAEESANSKLRVEPASETAPPALAPGSRPSRNFRYNYWWRIGLAPALLGVIAAFYFGRTRQAIAFYSSVPLTGYAGLEVCPSLSPAGDRIAFAWDGPRRDNFDIYVKQLGVAQPLRLTAGAEPDIGPAWSPDGGAIAFLHLVGNGKAEVSLTSALGPGPRRVLATIAVESPIGSYSRLRYIAWSADGNWLVLPDAPDSQRVYSLYLISTETGEKRRLTFPPPGFDDFDPAFSADMSRLAFARYSSLGAVASDIYILKISSDLKPQGEPRRLTALDRRTSSPVWMPDGEEILFARKEAAGNDSLWRINVKHPQEMKPLPIRADSASALALSRSGNKIVYTRDVDYSNIWGVSLDAGSAHRQAAIRPWITSSSSAENPQFSPDGRHIAYQSARSGTMEIWVCDRDGSHPRQLTNLGAIISGFPRWSPDGRKIVFHSRLKTMANLYIVDANGGAPQPLTGGVGATPSWSGDGKWIYFTSTKTGEPDVWRLPVGGGAATQLTKGKTFCPMPSQDGLYLYFATVPELALRRLPLLGGAETQLFSGLAAGASFAPTKHGIYFIRAQVYSDNEELAFFDFATGQIKRVIAIPGKATLGLTVSPDERLILYGQSDQLDSDLMLIDQFR